MEKAIVFVALLVATLVFAYFLGESQYVAKPSLEYSPKVGRKCASRILWFGGTIYFIVFAVLCWLSPVEWYLIASQAAAWVVFFMALAFCAVRLWIAAFPALIAAASLFAYFVIEIFWVAVVGGVFFLLVVVAVLLFKRHDN